MEDDACTRSLQSTRRHPCRLFRRQKTQSKECKKKGRFTVEWTRELYFVQSTCSIRDSWVHGLEFCSQGFQTWKQNTKFYYPNHLRNIPLISTPTILGEGHPKLKNLHRSEAGASVAHFCLNTRQFCNINSKENEVPLHPQPVSSSYI